MIERSSRPQRKGAQPEGLWVKYSLLIVVSDHLWQLPVLLLAMYAIMVVMTGSWMPHDTESRILAAFVFGTGGAAFASLVVLEIASRRNTWTARISMDASGSDWAWEVHRRLARRGIAGKLQDQAVEFMIETLRVDLYRTCDKWGQRFWIQYSGHPKAAVHRKVLSIVDPILRHSKHIRENRYRKYQGLEPIPPK